VWHTEQTWKTHEGFYGKKWIFSYVPNFGGKTPLTGELDMYATASTEALHSPYGKTLIGFGSAPEGLENNEVVYELLADMGWRTGDIDLDEWLPVYCKARYGACPDKMNEAWNLLRQSAYGSLYSYPRFTWQTVVPDQRRVSLIDKSPEFMKAVALFLDCSDELKTSQLYLNDAIELAAMYLGVVADNYYEKALEADAAGQKGQATALLSKTTALLHDIDRLLASHPRYRLEEWVEYAKAQGTTLAEKDAYEANARRLITTWGGFQDDYAARFWSGLIGDYYIPRIEMYFSEGRYGLREWEEQWISRPWKPSTQPFSEPLTAAKQLVAANPQIN
jgi:alpha-N-acetylglucosaminidase